MLQRFKTFSQVVQQATVVQAAEVLHLTQPTVSRQIQQLEADVGMALFERVGKRLALNHAGEVVYEYAQRFVALDEKMRDELNSLTDPERGTVYLGVGLTPSIYFLPQVLAQYHRFHPGVQFQVRTGSSREILSMLAAREIDAGIVTTVSGLEPNIETLPLYRDELWLVASAQHDLAREQSISFGALRDLPFVLLHRESGLRQLIDQLASRHGMDITVTMETDSLESINRLVQNGLGISFLPKSSVVDDVQSGKLVRVPVADVDLGARTVTLVARTGSFMSASTARFVEHLAHTGSAGMR